MLDTRKIVYFITVAEEQSFTKAAQRLNMAQPPLSKQISSLEDEVGFPLFERGRRKIPTLTPEGRLFYDEAKKVISGLGNLQRFTASQANMRSGKISVSYTPSFANTVFADFLRGFQKQNKSIELNLSELTSKQQLEQIESGQIDAGFIRMIHKVPSQLTSHRILVQKMKLAVPVGHPLSEKTQAKWEDLDGQNLILIASATTGPNFYLELFSKLEKAKAVCQLSRSASGIWDQIWRVSAGQGLAPVPLYTIPKTAGVKWIDLPADTPAQNIGMVWRKGTSSASVDQFITAAKEYWKKRDV